jgi:hypothetical protein
MIQYSLTVLSECWLVSVLIVNSFFHYSEGTFQSTPLCSPFTLLQIYLLHHGFFILKWARVIGSWRKLHNLELCDLYFSPTTVLMG